MATLSLSLSLLTGSESGTASWSSRLGSKGQRLDAAFFSKRGPLGIDLIVASLAFPVQRGRALSPIAFEDALKNQHALSSREGIHVHLFS